MKPHMPSIFANSCHRKISAEEDRMYFLVAHFRGAGALGVVISGTRSASRTSSRRLGKGVFAGRSPAAISCASLLFVMRSVAIHSWRNDGRRGGLASGASRLSLTD
jgi:hypothetical protein